MYLNLIKSTFLLLFLTTLFLFITFESIYNKNHDTKLQENQHRMNKRKAQLDIVCTNYLGNLKVNNSHIKHVYRKFFVDTKYNISWCPIYKAASTVWLNGFAQLGGGLNKKTLKYINTGIVNWNQVARKLYPVKIKDIHTNLLNTTKFLIVRHPFERLISMYQDNWNVKIRNKKYLFKDQPNFRTFITTLVTNFSLFDDFWKPISNQCLPCYLRYDYIIKTETFLDDNKYMLKQLSLGRRVNLKFVEDAELNRSLLRFYFSSLSQVLLEKLYKLYKHDFLLFGYTSEEYFKMAKHKK